MLKRSFTRHVSSKYRFSSSSTSGDGNTGSGTGKDKLLRERESRGAMNEFISNLKTQPKKTEGGSSLWSKLRVNTSSDGSVSNANNNQRIMNPRQSGQRTSQGQRLEQGHSNQQQPRTAGQWSSKAKRNQQDNKRKSAPGSLEESGLYEFDYFDSLVKKGLTLDMNESDELDQWLAVLYLNSYKTPDNVVRDIAVSTNLKRVHIPSPRPLEELLDALLPKITTAPKDSDGYLLGLQAWAAISKHNLYSEERKREICNLVASQANRFIEKALKLQKDEEEGLEEPMKVFDPNFRVQPERFIDHFAYSEEEVVETIVSEYVVTDDTDWDVDAVVDEDQL